MKYKKDDLAKMSDAEINQLLTALRAGEPWPTHGELIEGGSAFNLADPLGNPFYLNVTSYCSDWAAIMPLAVEHDIIHDYTINGNARKVFHAYHKRLEISSDWSRSLQRAIACCLILVLQEQQQ